VANAGHVVPLLRRASGEVVPLGAASGPPVGMLPTQRYRDESFTLEVGDIVVLMTDGIMEALHDENDEMGMAQLIALIGKGPRNLGEINTRIIEAVDERTRGAITDDITILSLEVTPRA
jgi:sigma-B regulation protein RsbU (phosphoserine phosphatase)